MCLGYITVNNLDASANTQSVGAGVGSVTVIVILFAAIAITVSVMLYCIKRKFHKKLFTPRLDE